MKRDYIERVVNACPVEYYLSSKDGVRVHWPYRMQPVHEAVSTYQEDSERYILDSSFADETITNQDTLDKAHKLNADIAVLEDVYQDYEQTVDRLKEGLQLAQEHDFAGNVMCPLQAPHVDCWKAIGKPDIVAIGGMKDEPASEKVRIAQKLRDAVGDDVWIHGLGFGATPEIVRAVRNDPDLLDSIDAQTPFANENDTSVWPGTERMSPVALRCQATLVEKCRRMSTELTDDPEANQTVLEDY